MQFFPGEVLNGGGGVPRDQVLQQSLEFFGEVLTTWFLNVSYRGHNCEISSPTHGNL